MLRPSPAPPFAVH